MGFAKDTDGFYTATPTAGWQDGFRTGAPSTSTTMIIFVSNVTGKDSAADGTFNAAIEGSFAQPYKTIAKALTRTGGTGSVRAGSPDWILLATGETWTDEFPPNYWGGGLNEQNRMIFSSYDKTATVSQSSNIPPIPNPRTGVVARPIIKTPLPPYPHTGFEYIYGNTAIMGIDFYAYTRDTVANPANASNADPGPGILFSNATANALIEDNRIRYFSDGITAGTGMGTGGPLQLRRNVIHNCWGDKYGIGSAGVETGFLIEENLVDHCGWDAVGQPDGDSLNHNFYLNGNNDLTGGTGPQYFLSDLTMHGNISLSCLFQDNNRVGGTLSNNLWQLGGTGGTNYGPNNPAVANLVENEVYIGGFLGGAAHTNWTPWGIEMKVVIVDGHPGYYGNGVPGIQHVYINGCIATQGIVNGNATQGLLDYGSNGAWANLGTITNCKTYKFSGTTVYTATETITDGGGNLGTNSPTTAAANGWPFPERTPETYMAEVIGDGSTWADFSRRCRLQSRRNWNPLLMAESVNDYIRQGFNMPMIGSAYAGFSPGTPPTLMAQICM